VHALVLTTQSRWVSVLSLRLLETMHRRRHRFDRATTRCALHALAAHLAVPHPYADDPPRCGTSACICHGVLLCGCGRAGVAWAGLWGESELLDALSSMACRCW
jgi:hypothetical protein